MAVRYHTRWDGKQFTSKPLRDLLNARIGWFLEVRLRLRRNNAKAGFHRYYRGTLLPTLHEEMVEQGTEGRYGGPITEEEVHELLKLRFLRVTHWYEDEQRYVEDIPSTGAISQDEFLVFLTLVERWMVEFWNIELDTDEFRQSGQKERTIRDYFTRGTE